MALFIPQYIHHLLKDRIDIKAVSSFLGHTSINTTEKYLHALDSRDWKATNKPGRITFDI